MANNIGLVSLNGIYHEDSQVTWNLASGIVAADVGKAVTIDSSAANTVKLAGDGEAILGRLEVVESRAQEGAAALTGAVAMRGSYKFLVNPDAVASPDETPAVGDYLVGGTDDDTVKGYVQKSADNAATGWLTVEVGSGYVIAIKV